MFKDVESIKEWKGIRNNFSNKSVIVVPRRLFKETYTLLVDCDDIAFISIECVEEYLWKGRLRPNMHLVESSDNVLNIDFDDVETDGIDDEGNHWYAITDEQGQEIANFIEMHLGKHFVIHCTAGKSRSQGVAKAIFDVFPDIYSKNKYSEMNPSITPNYAVSCAIKKAFKDRLFVF